MAAANESQGLKIAVAVFVTLTVMMAVGTYFSYSAYTTSDAKLAKAASDLGLAKKAAGDALNQLEDLRKAVGVRAEDPELIKTEIKNEYKKIDDVLKTLGDQVNTMITQAQSKGAAGPELEDAKSKVQQTIAAFRSEPNKTYISSNARLTDLLSNLSMLTTQLSLNYVDVKRNLESTNGVNDKKLQVAIEAVTKAKKDLAAEQQKHVDERQTILSKIDQYTSENAKLVAEVQNLSAKGRKSDEDYTKNMALAQLRIRELRARLEEQENILERPSGQITFVDHQRGEVHVNLTRSSGVRPQMKFTVFASNAPGLPTATPKGSIELTSVGDRDSIGRIVSTASQIDPISPGDHIYSPGFSHEPMRFALIGKMDVNRDGRDDRGDLKRMIEQSGGIVDYDLPPPELGKETGKLTSRDAWYVIDERPPFQQVYGTKGVTASENAEFLKKQSDAIREARINGVRPMRLERLLPYLGYDMLAPTRGTAEAVDAQSLKRLGVSRQDVGKPKPQAPADAKTEDAAPAAKEETPKDESK